MNIRYKLLNVCAALAVVAAMPATAQAEDDYVVGSSVGLTGYATTVDRSWIDGVRIGVDQINAEGGVLGRQFKLVMEDNRSEPQEAVAAYRKMISSDKAEVFLSGCLSSGNFAAAPIVVRKDIPMVLCSILPNDDKLVPWMFSLVPHPKYEVETYFSYLRDKTGIREIGILYDQSPYAGFTFKIAQGLAESYGLKIVGAEQYVQTDADFSVVLKKLYADGARALVKMGTGPSSVTVVKNIKGLGLDLPIMASTDDLEILTEAAKVMGPDLHFVASLTQVYDALPADHPIKSVSGPFLAKWTEAYGSRDTLWGARGYDATLVLAAAIKQANSFEGEKVRDALNATNNFQGTSSIYNFADNHSGVTTNPYVMAHIVDGKLIVLK